MGSSIHYDFKLHVFTPSIAFSSQSQAVCDTVALPDVCCTEQLSCQRHLLEAVSAIIDKAGEETSLHSFTLFYVLMHVMALQPQGSLQQEVEYHKMETFPLLALSTRRRNYFQQIDYFFCSDRRVPQMSF